MAHDRVDPPERVNAAPRVALAAASALALLVLILEARDQWFFNDDWGQWGAHRVGPRIDQPAQFFFGPHNGHWMTLNRVVFEGIYRMFGLRSYLPYLVPVFAVHVCAVWLLFALMRRAGVRPWLACAGAAMFAFFGSGAEVLTWADAFGFVAPLAFATAQLMLVDHDGALDRRDAAGLALGVASIVSGGASLTMIAVVAVSLILVRRWRAMVVATVLPAALWCAWFVAIGHEGAHTFVDRAHAPNMAAYFWRSITSSVDSVTQLGASGVIVVALVVFAWWRPERWCTHGRAPVAALASGVVVFAAQTTLARVNLGVELASSSRYLYVGGFLLLPFVMLAIDEVVTLRPRVLPVALLFVVWALVANAFAIDSFARAWGPRKQAIRSAVATVAQLDGVDALPPGTRLVDPGRAFDPEWAPTVDVIRALRDHGDLPTFATPSEADRLTWATRLLVRIAEQPGPPGKILGGVRVDSDVTTTAIGDGGCVDLVASRATNRPPTVRLSDVDTVWIEATTPTKLTVRLVSLIDHTIGEPKQFDVFGAVRLHVGVAHTEALLAFDAPTLRLCG